MSAITKGSKPKLTYLFVAQFKDGTHVEQTAEDVSTLLPPDKDGNGKSAFYDVRMRLDEVARFHLVGEHVYTVNLETGHFEVNGVAFGCHDQHFKPAGPLQLVYWREVTVHDVGGKGQRHVISRYFMGWKTLDEKGEVYQRTICIGGED